MAFYDDPLAYLGLGSISPSPTAPAASPATYPEDPRVMSGDVMPSGLGGSQLPPSPVSRLGGWLGAKWNGLTDPVPTHQLHQDEDLAPTPALQTPAQAPQAPSAAPLAAATQEASQPAPAPATEAMPVPPVPPQAPPSPMAQATAEQAAPQQASPDGWDIVSNKRNNPLNLRFAGQDGAQNVNGFAAFPNVDAGLAAAQHQFALNAKRGINTLNGLISSWAPPNENDTKAYISTVSGMTGIAPDAKIDITDPAIQKKVMAAMSRMENGPGPSAPIGQSQVADQAPTGDASPSVSLASSSSEPAPQQAPSQIPQGGPGDMDMQSILAGFKPSQSQQLSALASGLLSGPTFGRGLGQGLQNLAGVNQQAQENALKVAQARAMAAYHQGTLGINQQNAITKAGTLTEKSAHDQVGENLGQQRIDQNDPVAAARAKALQAQVGKTDAQTNLIENGGTSKQAIDNKDEDAFVKSQDAARDSNRAAADVMALLDKEGKAGLTGPDATSRIKRFMANSFGMDVDGVSPSGIAIAQKDLANLQTKGMMASTDGKIPRALGEYNGIAKGFGDISTNPDALRVIVQGTIDSNNRLLSAGTAWREMKPEDRSAAKKQYGGFSGWRDAFSAARSDNASMTGNQQPAPTIQQGEKGGWTHKDPASGLGFTIH